MQYSHVILKKDAIRWLTDNGRLPSFTSDEYFEEIKTLKKYKEENQAQAEEILALKQEIERLNRSSFKAIKGFFTPRKKSEEHK